MPPRYYRKIIQIRAVDSPNVRRALRQQAQGLEPDGVIICPGVLTWDDYKKRRATWDRVRQTIGLDAEFYEGAEVLLYPPEWLNRAEQLHLLLQGKSRRARAVGIDPAEGGDKTAMAAVDEYGLIELVSKRTPDTSVITGEALAFARKHAVEWPNVIFDRGGGGKEHADRLRSQGYHVRTVAFGESLVLEPKRGIRLIEEKKEHSEERYAYRNRRAEMYGTLRALLDPGNQGVPIGPITCNGFALPPSSAGDVYADLRRQLAPIPLTYDPEGRLELPPKNRRAGEEINPDKKTLVELIGHSPDEADALVLAIFGMLNKTRRNTAGAR